MTTLSPPEGGSQQSPAGPGPSPSRRVVIGALVLAFLLVLGVGLVLLLRPQGGPVVTPTPIPTPAPVTSAPVTSVPATSAPATSAPATSAAPRTSAPVPADAVTAVWPTAASGVRYGSPAAAARGFAVTFAGFRDPVVGTYRAADSRSGEVDVRPAAAGPVTTVLVRRFSDGTWWVLGAATADVVLDRPAAGAVLASPAVLSGSALAFEGNVAVRIVDDAGTVLARGAVTGGGDVMRPFTGTFPLAAAGTARGAVVLTVPSARDGSVVSTSVVRVAFPT